LFQECSGRLGAIAFPATEYSAKDLAGDAKVEFVSAIWDSYSFEDTALVISFGTDSSLKTATGWDDVTGVGTPNAQAFADFFYAQ
jgi:hypothetical protein